MIGVVVPAHNEAACLAGCLRSLVAASTHPELSGEAVRIVVVLDGCTDLSATIAAQFPVISLASSACNVGEARAAGAQAMLDVGARWLAFTDADSVVSERWLVDQLALSSDAVCGTVVVDDWSDYALEVQRVYDAHYCQLDGHRHIHGANLGVSADAYRRVGGFEPLKAHEDVALVRALERAGAQIAWSAKPVVRTSARCNGRAPEGFAGYLRALQRQVQSVAECLDYAPNVNP